jgi:quercetin dioxygenase-like cupin family protein
MMAATLEVMDADRELRSGYLAPFCEASGAVRSVLFHPAGYSLWEVEAELGAGTELRWHVRHGDEVVFVIDGELRVDGVQCGPNAAAIVEADVPTTARALTDLRVLHFGPASPEPPSEGPLGPARSEGHRVHVIEQEAAALVGDPAGHGSRYYRDSTCETCRAAFFEPFDHAPFVTPSHVHSEDEIIRVLDGELRLGRMTLRPGMSIAIPGGARYSFRTPGGYSFLNYRRDAATCVVAPGTPPVLETVESARQSWARVE